ncbi:hypothetical protein JHK82_051640 [Glycine max]|nr:hypothetical protein JHK85_052342 [Glycine max]KAG5092862.1 hypothetical protein JHK82_051640 [Glycine max]KAG5095926.1 hypothetical protein JHK84_051514 [Glycine max]
MAKFFAAMILALIAISMLQTVVMAANEQGGHLYDNKVYPLLILHSLVSLSLWGVKNEKWGFGILISKGSTSADLSFLIVFFFRANMEVGVSRDTNAHHNARGDVARPNTTSPACFSVRSAAGNACVCPRGIMVIKLCALATTTGRPRKEDPSALELQLHQIMGTLVKIDYQMETEAVVLERVTMDLHQWRSSTEWTFVLELKILKLAPIYIL